MKILTLKSYQFFLLETSLQSKYVFFVQSVIKSPKIIIIEASTKKHPWVAETLKKLIKNL